MKVVNSRAEAYFMALQSLSRSEREAVTTRLLEDNPRPPGMKKLSAREEYRLRVGD